MKYIIFTLVICISTSCQGQHNKATSECLLQQNKRQIYAALKKIILENTGAIGIYLSDFYSQFEYNDIRFSHRVIPNHDPKKFPKVNREAISVITKNVNYILLYGGHSGDTNVSIEIKDFSKEKEKIVQQKAEDHFCKILSKMNFDIKISAKEAVAIATKNAGGFLGGWVTTTLKDKNWHISASPLFDNPPMYYIVDANNGAILLKLDNSDDLKQQKKLKKFLNKISKGPSIMNNETSCFSTVNFDKVYDYISEQLKKSNHSFYLYEEYELYLQENEIALKKNNYTLCVISKEKGIFTLANKGGNTYLVDKTHQIFCKLVEQATANDD